MAADLLKGVPEPEQIRQALIAVAKGKDPDARSRLRGMLQVTQRIKGREMLALAMRKVLERA